MSTTAVMNWRTPEYLAEEAHQRVQSASDAAALGRVARQEIEFAGDGAEPALAELAREAVAAAELLESKATALAAKLKKAARRKAAA
jgi:hypothetical protein